MAGPNGLFGKAKRPGPTPPKDPDAARTLRLHAHKHNGHLGTVALMRKLLATVKDSETVSLSHITWATEAQRDLDRLEDSLRHWRLEPDGQVVEQASWRRRKEETHAKRA